jgi:putative phosphoribosyl transferase
MVFRNRRAAGKAVGALLARTIEERNVIVRAVGRNGLPVAYEVATRLQAPLDILLMQTVMVPLIDEYSIGMITSDGVAVLNDGIVSLFRLAPEQVSDLVRVATLEMRRNNHQIDRLFKTPKLASVTVILVDDGFASGATMCAAIESMRRQGARRIIASAPVGSKQACAVIARRADACLCAETPDPFLALEYWYEDFEPTGDGEVIALLESAGRRLTLSGKAVGV